MTTVAPNATDHIVVLVADMDNAIQTWETKLGFALTHTVELEEPGIRQAFFDLPDGTFIELVAPTKQDSRVSELIEQNGEGVHVLALRVDDLDASVAALQAQGVELIGVGTRQVFIKASFANGVLIQLWPSDQPHRWRDHPNLGRSS